MTTNKFYSPLRYPGGKNKLSNFISTICVDNDIDGHYIEPYAGGAAVALFLLMTGRVRRITINDYDIALYAFWWSVINKTEQLCGLIESRAVNPETWRNCKVELANKSKDSDLLELGYATLFLNRTNYSGVLNGGMIGGRLQEGKYKIDCRFNKQAIMTKIRKIAERRDDITLTNLDALKLIKRVKQDSNTLFYFDPPYYLKGPSLYLNSYGFDDHLEVSEAIKSIKKAKWVVSYDDAKPIQLLYRGLPTINYSFSHSVRSARKGFESIFADPRLLIDLKKDPIIDYR